MSKHMLLYAQDYAHVIHRHRHGQCCGVWAACAFFALVDQSVAPVETPRAPAVQRMHRHLVPPKGRLRNVIFVGHHHGRQPDLSGNVRMRYVHARYIHVYILMYLGLHNSVTFPGNRAAESGVVILQKTFLCKITKQTRVHTFTASGDTTGLSPSVGNLGAVTLYHRWAFSASMRMSHRC